MRKTENKKDTKACLKELEKILKKVSNNVSRLPLGFHTGSEIVTSWVQLSASDKIPEKDFEDSFGIMYTGECEVKGKDVLNHLNYLYQSINLVNPPLFDILYRKKSPVDIDIEDIKETVEENNKYITELFFKNTKEVQMSTSLTIDNSINKKQLFEQILKNDISFIVRNEEIKFTDENEFEENYNKFLLDPEKARTYIDFGFNGVDTSESYVDNNKAKFVLHKRIKLNNLKNYERQENIEQEIKSFNKSVIRFLNVIKPLYE